MAAFTSGRIWEEAESASAGRIARQFEADWHAAEPPSRPDPRAYLPEAPELASGALLALLRTELALRHAASEPIRLETYRDRFPELDAEAFVALAYEEFCLREEAGDAPTPLDYYERFPELESRLRRVLDIHELVGSARTVSFPTLSAPAIPFPEVGQTTGGFRLVAELGRGSFARVFRAEERQLADRPVALKVARTGSREPQTLARLQHTHIVPVYSYRLDPATDLHLLCMPYLGCVTLAKLLAHPGWKSAASGAAVLSALDLLAETGSPEPNPNASSRHALASREFVPAIAWWGARLAEALQHAHDRGVLHRDIKPSNVLVTSDGLPMLLDFNLAWESCLEDADVDPGALGGTLAYMAPEHLEALAEGHSAGVDARSDIYSLGVMLYEAMGRRPFEPPATRDSVGRMLQRMADQRRQRPSRLRDLGREVSPSFEAVVLRCLAADPAERYANAAELAADLQAVADDAPLPHTREPWPVRANRWFRRNRARAALLVPLGLAAAAVIFTIADTQFRRENTVGQIVGEMRQLINSGDLLLEQDQIERAMAQFETARKLGEPAAGRRAADWQDDERIEFWQDEARDKVHLAREKAQIRDRADELFARYEQLALHLMGFVGNSGGDPSAAVEKALQPFYVFQDRAWTARPEVRELDQNRLSRLLDTVDDLLFLWALHLESSPEPGRAERAMAVCVKGLELARDPGPWQVLQARCLARTSGKEVERFRPPDPVHDATSARACFRWGLLFAREGRTSLAITWLDRATRLDPMQFWFHYYLGLQYHRAGRQEALALAHYNVAVALQPVSPWVRFSRSNLFQRMGQWTRAMEDLDVALEHVRPREAIPMRLNRGTLNQTIGRYPAAREEYEAVIAATDPDTPFHRAARWNLAKLEAEAGHPQRALDIINELLEQDPTDRSARFSRALVQLRLDQPEAAEADLDQLIGAGGAKPEEYDLRARVRLVRGDAPGAAADAAAAWDLEPAPARLRMRIRTLLAQGRAEEIPLDDPDEWQRLPLSGPGLRADLARAAEELRGIDPSHRVARLNRALILDVLEERAEALAEADAIVAEDPESVPARWVRAYLRDRAGDFSGAIDDLERGLVLEPDDPGLLGARGALLAHHDRPREALACLDRALHGGARASIHRTRAEALLALGRNDDAVEAWTLAINADPQDPGSFLGRARASQRTGLWGDYAMADLEQAAAWAGDHPELLLEITREYARLVGDRADRLPRVLSLAGRSFGLYLRVLTDPAIPSPTVQSTMGPPNLRLQPPG